MSRETHSGQRSEESDEYFERVTSDTTVRDGQFVFEP